MTGEIRQQRIHIYHVVDGDIAGEAAPASAWHRLQHLRHPSGISHRLLKFGDSMVSGTTPGKYARLKQVWVAVAAAVDGIEWVCERLPT